MEDRLKEYGLNIPKEIKYEVLGETSDGIIIKVLKSTPSNYNYMLPPIPDGYKYVCGEWNSGFVIERISDGSQFVWVPVGSLDADGSHDGIKFNKKYGRRNFGDETINVREFHGAFSEELSKENESVKKHGGFYIGRYATSLGSDGLLHSIKGAMPWRPRYYKEAKEGAASFENNEFVWSSLVSGLAYDSTLAWFIKSEAKDLYDIAYDSTGWGNYWETENSPHEVVETGFSEKWKANNIYDLAGNIHELTLEESRDNASIALRGRAYYELIPGVSYNVACTLPFSKEHMLMYKDTGNRIALFLKD